MKLSFKTYFCNMWCFVRPIIVNYSFIVTRPHRKNLPQNAAWKLIIWSRMEKKSSFFQLLYKTQVRGIQNKTNNIKIVKINLFLSYKERTKHNIVIFSKILPNSKIITTCRIELRVQEMTMNEKLTMIRLNWREILSLKNGGGILM